MGRPIIKWQICRESDCYIRAGHELHHGCEMILITYRTPTGRRYVKAVRSNNGRVDKNINGTIIAWAYLPLPYDGDVWKPEDDQEEEYE